MAQVLAGDVGGTKTVLAIYQTEGEQLSEVCKKTYPSGQHACFEDLVKEFLHSEVTSQYPDIVIHAAVFGIAGPIKDQKCITTNLPWIIDASEVERELSIAKVHLLNDLESAAYGVLQLDTFYELNSKAIDQPGHKAVIAAGTGLGEAILYFDGDTHHAMPTEGGHSEFAPQNELEDQLLVFLRARFNGHVSLERILAGDGFGNLYDFLKSINYAPVNEELEAQMQQSDRNAVISIAGLRGEDDLCRKTMQMFCRIYGVEAGSLALKCLPLGGVYIAGGIAPKIRAALEAGDFMQGYHDKGRLSHAIEKIPVRVVDNPEAPLLGAAFYASRLLG